MIVVDASALLEVLLQTSSAGLVSSRIFMPGEILAAPHLITVEVAQVLRRYHATGTLDDLRAWEAMQDFADMPITKFPHDFLLPRIWELRNNLTAYDAVYLALAEALNATFLTRDSAFAAIPGTRTIVEIL